MELTKLLAVSVCLLGACFALFKFLHKPKRKLTREKMSALIEQFVVSPEFFYMHDWDDVFDIPIEDPELDAIRKRWRNLPKEFPPEKEGDFCSIKGILVLEEIARQLKSPPPV